ncbi:MAG: hypothetical protein J4215_03265 [Candidatus Diapherotrites archaeon]|uniref:Uncharacterized protein n=1 Tax=Candidatus Iainarchaeum sp. TaxID=3101447 RepID=A0A8T4LFA7_9ARCH|nr:hypothetical protein [Candidatus Diapherotrites archaeon]
MYPEQGGGAAPAEDYPADTGFRSRASNIESMIPLIIILIIAVYAGARFGFFSLPLPGLGTEPVRMLIIGEPSPTLKAILDEDRDLVRYTIRDARSLSVSPKDQLAQYKIVLLDQSKQADKSVPRVLGDAIQDWVKTGGKLIVVKDSGIYRDGASDVIGWKATFGDIMPVECNYEKDFVATCTRPVHVTAKIFQQDFKHKIMEGIEVAPADPDAVLFLETFNVTPIGNQVAYIQNVTTPAWYPAVVEKTWFGIGKVIYFNYDPGATKGVFENTLKYLR